MQGVGPPTQATYGLLSAYRRGHAWMLGALHDAAGAGGLGLVIASGYGSGRPVTGGL
jgi:hypothetical protein